MAASTEQLARTHLHKQVPDPRAAREAHAAATAIGCKRDPDLRRLLPRARAAERRARHRRHRGGPPALVVTADGVEHEVDAIIFGTGFHVTDMPIASWCAAATGARSPRLWEGSPQAYLGTDGRRLPQPVPPARAEHRPRPQLGRVHDRGADQLRDGRAARRWTRAAPTSSRCAQEAQDAYNDAHPERAAGHGLDSGGCASWYLDAQRAATPRLARLHLAASASGPATSSPRTTCSRRAPGARAAGRRVAA